MEITFSGASHLEVLKQIQEYVASLAPAKDPAQMELPLNYDKPAPVKTVKAETKAEKPKAEKKFKAPAPVQDDIFVLEKPKDLEAPVNKPHNAPKYTKDEIREKLKAVMGKHGLPKVQELLGKFGIDSISKLDEKRYFELVEVIDQTL